MVDLSATCEAVVSIQGASRRYEVETVGAIVVVMIGATPRRDHALGREVSI